MGDLSLDGLLDGRVSVPINGRGGRFDESVATADELGAVQDHD